MVIYGGRSSDQVHNLGPDYYSNKVSYYNTTTSTWHTPDIRPPLPSGRRSHSALCLDNGKLVIFGGYNGYILKTLKFPFQLMIHYTKLTSFFSLIYFFYCLSRTKEHKNDLWLLDTDTWTWSPLTPGGQGPNARRRQALVKVADKLFLFGGTSPYYGPPLYFTKEQLEFLPQQEEDTTSKLMDHNDLYVLDMSPSLKTLAIMSIIDNKLSTEVSNLYMISVTLHLNLSFSGFT